MDGSVRGVPGNWHSYRDILFASGNRSPVNFVESIDEKKSAYL
jgi:hypothetical protein